MKTNQLRNSWTLRTGPRRKRLASSVILVVVGLLAATFEGVGGPAANAQQSPEWLTIANAYRTSAGLPAVTADPALQAGVDAHVKYLAATGSLSHVEATSQPLYTPEGDLAAQQSILAGWTGPAKSDRELIDGWMTAPFHSIHLFEPRLRKAAYAVQRDPGSALSSAAVMNIIGGIGPKVALGPVIVFPARDSVTPLTSFLVEAPNPLTNCPGYVAPSGMGILALFPKPIPTATVTMTANGAPVESCTIDANYKNPDPAGQATVIQILTQKNAVVVIPRLPLVPGTTYNVDISGSGQQVTWKFTTSAPGGALPAAAAASSVDPTATTLAGGSAASQRKSTTTKRKTTKRRRP